MDTNIKPGSIRVINQRWDSQDKPDPEDEELIIKIDRSSGSPLGNQHSMREKTLKERLRVIELNTRDMEQDIGEMGTMYQELKRISQIVANGQNVALQCWCSPLPCHGDAYVPVIRAMVKNLQEDCTRGLVKDSPYAGTITSPTFHG